MKRFIFFSVFSLPLISFAQGAVVDPLWEMALVKVFCWNFFDCLLQNFLLNPLKIVPTIVGVVILWVVLERLIKRKRQKNDNNNVDTGNVIQIRRKKIKIYLLIAIVVLAVAVSFIPHSSPFRKIYSMVVPVVYGIGVLIGAFSILKLLFSVLFAFFQKTNGTVEIKKKWFIQAGRGTGLALSLLFLGGLIMPFFRILASFLFDR